MRILVDVGHPAHVHLFKNMIFDFIKKGHEIQVTARDKEVTLTLLNAYGINYISIGENQRSLLKKAIYMIVYDLKLLKIARKFMPDVFVSTGSPYAAQVSTLIGKPHIVFSDTEHANLIFKLVLPFTDMICTPSCFKKDFGPKQIRYNGYHELAYLHPNYFTPDPSVLDELGIKEGERFIIMRFVAWNASHDAGHKGISMEMRRRFVSELEKFGRILITSESELPAEFEPYRITVAPEKMHDLLYYASLLIGESATMASECAVLGTPAVYIDFVGRGYTDEQELKYGLVYNFRDDMSSQENALEKAIKLLENSDIINDEWQKAQRRLLKENIDVTKFMINLIENYSNV